MTLFARFLEKMTNTPDGDGSLLDHMLLVYGSGMANGNQHTHNPLPMLVAGGAHGRHRGNKHILTAKDTPLANFLVGRGGQGGYRDAGHPDDHRARGDLRCVVHATGHGIGRVVALATAGLRAADSELVTAVKNGDRAAVRTLLRNPATVNLVEPDGSTALHWAVQADDLETVDRLIRAGAKVSVATRYGVTPLTLAARNGNTDIVERLLRAGANPQHAIAGGRDRPDDCRAGRGDHGGQAAAGARCRHRRARAVPGADRADVGRRGESCAVGRHAARGRCVARYCRQYLRRPRAEAARWRDTQGHRPRKAR